MSLEIKYSDALKLFWHKVPHSSSGSLILLICLIKLTILPQNGPLKILHAKPVFKPELMRNLMQKTTLFFEDVYYTHSLIKNVH